MLLMQNNSIFVFHNCILWERESLLLYSLNDYFCWFRVSHNLINYRRSRVFCNFFCVINHSKMIMSMVDILHNSGHLSDRVWMNQWKHFSDWSVCERLAQLDGFLIGYYQITKERYACGCCPASWIYSEGKLCLDCTVFLPQKSNDFIEFPPKLHNLV